MPARRALVVGIDDYSFGPLTGCVNDAKAIASLLSIHEDGSPNFDVQLVTSPPSTVTRASLKKLIEKLFTHDEADVALLYFSGHGTENNLGGFLVTTDAKVYDEGVNLGDVLTLANKSRAKQRVIILDSCMSGALGDVPAIGSTSANLNQGVSVLTASRADQVALESGGGGVFTELVCGALEGGAADVLGNVTAANIYAYVEEALGPWEQRPLFKAHLSKLVALRQANPSVPIDVLRQLTTWFPTVDAEFSLDPSFEYTTESPDGDNVRTFKNIQRCRDSKLIEAVGEEFLYWAAMHSKSCKLTPLGQRYWRLLDGGRI